MKKKLRGLKRRWKQMIANLDKLAENIDYPDDEIFIAESFDYFNRKISTPYKIELFDKLLNIISTKQKNADRRCYLLWYLPNDIFESTILIFNGFNELATFLKERKYSNFDSDNYKLLLNQGAISENYISARVKSEEMLSATVIIDDEEPIDKVAVILLSNEKVIAMAKKELS